MLHSPSQPRTPHHRWIAHHPAPGVCSGDAAGCCCIARVLPAWPLLKMGPHPRLYLIRMACEQELGAEQVEGSCHHTQIGNLCGMAATGKCVAVTMEVGNCIRLLAAAFGLLAAAGCGASVVQLRPAAAQNWPAHANARLPEFQEASDRAHCAFACTLQSKNPRALRSNLPPECPLPIDLCPGAEALQRPDDQGLICAGSKPVCLNALPLSGVPTVPTATGRAMDHARCQVRTRADLLAYCGRMASD